MDNIKKVKLTRVSEDIHETEDLVVREFPLTIFINDMEYHTLLCSPENLEALVYGHLKSEMLIKKASDVKSLIVDYAKGLAHVDMEKLPEFDLKKRYITSGCASSAVYYDTQDAIVLRQMKARTTQVKKDHILSNMKCLSDLSETFKETGGVHIAGLFEEDKLIKTYEDIGRHNAIDKLIGYMVMEELKSENLMICTSGRISSEMVLKCTKSQIGVLVSKSAPMDLAIKIAEMRGMILIGFARGKRFNIYTKKSGVKL